MATDPREADREAADWFLLLNEEPEDTLLNKQFEDWLDADPSHMDAWARISETGAALASASLEEWNRAAPPRPRSAPRNTRGARRWTTLPRRKYLLGAAAAAAVIFTVLPSASLYLRADHMTGTAQVENVRLADGSTVQLGPGSAIAVDYEGKNRQVRLLTGRAWFAVVPDRARPFRVNAGHVSATVLGTAFEVKRLGPSTIVAVEHGRVRVREDASRPAEQRDLTAGQWIRIEPDHHMEQGGSPPDMIAAWRKGRLLVHNRTIADVIEDVRPWYAGQIILADRNFGQRRVTGFYELTNPAVTLESLVHPGGGKIVRLTPWLMIVTGP